MQWRVMVVDDEPFAVNELTYLLEQTGQVAELCSFTESVHVLERVREWQPDVLFLDVEMPGVNGLQLAEQLRKDEYAGGVVFVTAHPQFALQAFDLSVVDYLTKPVKPARLMHALERLQLFCVPKPRMQEVAAIQCFGEFQIRGPNGVMQFKTSKAEELCAYFVIHRKSTMQRMIREVFADSDEQAAANYVHLAIYQIRQAIKAAGLEKQLALNYVNRAYEFVSSGLQTDLDRFAAASDPEERVHLYHGDALAHFYTDWTLSVSDTYRIQYTEALRQAVRQAEQRGDPQAVRLYEHKLKQVLDEPPE